MTYNVFGGTLSLTQSINDTACSQCVLLYCMLAAVDFVAAMSQ